MLKCVVGVALICAFPINYPSESIPDIIVEIEKGLNKKHVDELNILISKTAKDNLGSPSIFSITEVVKEWLLENNIPGQDGSMYADMMRKQQQKDIENKRKQDKMASYLAADLESKKDIDNITPEEMERIRKRQAGHPCTLESFNAWKEKFDQEMSNSKESQNLIKIDILTENDRPTGKQLFMLNKAGVEIDLEEALIEEGEKEDIDEEQEQLILKKLLQTDTIKVEEDDDDDDEDYVPNGDEDDDDDEDS